MIFFAAASGIGAPKVLIILLTSASQVGAGNGGCMVMYRVLWHIAQKLCVSARPSPSANSRSEEHTSELQSRLHLVCRLLLEKKKRFMASQLILSAVHAGCHTISTSAFFTSVIFSIA